MTFNESKEVNDGSATKIMRHMTFLFQYVVSGCSKARVSEGRLAPTRVTNCANFVTRFEIFNWLGSLSCVQTPIQLGLWLE
jgi:hypothetical protein